MSQNRKKLAVTGIFKGGKPDTTSKIPTSPSLAIKVNTQVKDQQQEPKRFFESAMMEQSADAGNNNNGMEMDKTIANSDGQAAAKLGANLSEKKLNGSVVNTVVSGSGTINNNSLISSKSGLNLKPETPDDDGYALGSNLIKSPNQDTEFYSVTPAREKSAVASSRWGTRGSGSPGSGEPNSRPLSPSMDNYSESGSHGLARPKSRQEMPGSSGGGAVTAAAGGMAYPNSRYNVSNFWKARRIMFYRNGDPFFPAVEFRFKPGRDISTLDKLLDKISSRMDLPRGARYIFSMDGDRKTSLDELEDGSSYVVSSFKQFKVSLHASGDFFSWIKKKVISAT